MNTFYIACVLALLGVAHGFSMTMNASERTYIMVCAKEFFFLEFRRVRDELFWSEFSCY